MSANSPEPQPRAPVAGGMMIFLLVAVTAAPQASLQIFLPALPAIQADFATTIGIAQLSLSLSIFAGALATLVYGPLSDAYGRRPVLLAGLVIFTVSSLAAAIAPSIGWLIAGRVVQAVGAASGLVLARAMVRDLFDRERSASVIAYLTMATVVAPMLAPTVGAVIADTFGWRAIFYTVAAVAGLLLLLSSRYLVETRPPRSAGHAAPGIIDGAKQLLRMPAFVSYMLQSALAIATFFAFLAGAPYFLVNVLGRTATEYGLWFIPVSAAFMLGNLVSARLVRRVGMHRLITVGSVLCLGVTIAQAGFYLGGEWGVLALFLPTAMVGFGNGLSIANAMAGAVSVNPQLAGTASGLCGFTQMLFAALVSQVVGVLQDGTPYAMSGAMLLCALLSLASFRFFQGRADRDVRSGER